MNEEIVSISDESLALRLRETIGDEPISSFARRCGIGESLVRKYLHGSQPNALNLVLLADTGRVALDWLAAGRMPREKPLPSTEEELPLNQEERDEIFVLRCYRRASRKQKVAIQTILDALSNP